jgi:hypothetical protein
MVAVTAAATRADPPAELRLRVSDCRIGMEGGMSAVVVPLLPEGASEPDANESVGASTPGLVRIDSVTDSALLSVGSALGGGEALGPAATTAD